ncbi:MAG: hypothetical protein AB7S26_05420 [Sandaracinaceae bacterium]
MTPRERASIMVVVLSLGATVAFAQDEPSAPRLLTGGTRATFRSVSMTSMSDPVTIEITSGGSFDVRSLETAPSCRGSVMLRPDAIVRLTDPPPSMRIAVRAAGDTTLVVHTPDDRWLCDDDSGGGVNPALLVEHPLEGQYDVWVGSYRADQAIHGRLTIE